MPYVLVSGHPVFLSKSRYFRLREQASKDRDAVFRVASLIAGTKAMLEVESRMVTILEAEYSKDPIRFFREWVEFDMEGSEARQEVWYLLYDYCHLYGHTRLTDLRADPEIARLVGDLLSPGYNVDPPMGRVFALEHPSQRRKRWLWLGRQERQGTLRVIIDTALVTRLVGSLREFEVFTQGMRLQFGESVAVLPHPTSEHN